MLIAITALSSLAFQDAPKPRFCVIAPHAWQAALKPFIDARSREFEVEFASIETAAGAETGRDAPERIKHWLYDAWKQRGAQYALLIGDADTFPIRFMVLDRTTPAAFNYAFYASDLYYADIADGTGAFDDWNHNKTHFHATYFGEVRGETNKSDPINYDGVSYAPELALGRWPVSSEHELAALVAKTLAWRPTATRARALFVHADGWVDAREHVRVLATELDGAHFQVANQIYGDALTAPTPQRICAALGDGIDLAFHIGHGTTDSWAGLLGRAEYGAVRSAHPAIMVSIGCNTAELCTEPPYMAYVDESGIQHRGTNDGDVFSAPPPPPACLQPGRYNSTGLGEELLRLPSGGAVAYIGCATGAQPCALTLVDGLVHSMAKHPTTRIGDAWRDALINYWGAEHLSELTPNSDWYPPSIFFQGMKFLLFGDPTLMLTQPK